MSPDVNMLIENINKGSVSYRSSNDNNSIGVSLSDILSSFMLEKYTVCFVCGLRSPSVPMALAHPLYPIRSRSRNKHRILWVGWCVSAWRPCFWSVCSIYYYIHNMYYSCILSNWNKLVLGDIYIPRVDEAMTVCRMIWYCHSFLPVFKCIFQLYKSGFYIS